jgi:hypothetical protein
MDKFAKGLRTINDSALGCSLKYGTLKDGIEIIKGPFIDWEKVRLMLKEKKVL